MRRQGSCNDPLMRPTSRRPPRHGSIIGAQVLDRGGDADHVVELTEREARRLGEVALGALVHLRTRPGIGAAASDGRRNGKRGYAAEVRSCTWSRSIFRMPCGTWLPFSPAAERRETCNERPEAYGQGCGRDRRDRGWRRGCGPRARMSAARLLIAPTASSSPVANSRSER